MAAGFTLKTEKGREAEAVEAMRRRMNENCTLSAEDMVPVVYIDAAADPCGITVEMIRRMEALGPFGTGNTKPLLAMKDIHITGIRPLKGGKFFYLFFRTQMGSGKAICFNSDRLELALADAVGPEEAAALMQGSRPLRDIPMDIVFYAEIDRYNGSESVSIKVQHLRPHI